MPTRPDEFTAEQVLEVVLQVAAEHPDATGVLGQPEADTCVYFVYDDDGEPVPSCIVGHAFARLGLKPSGLPMWNGSAVADLYPFTPARAALATIQARQDEGARWGAAVYGVIDGAGSS